MSSLDVDSIDKTNFICITLKDKSIYFGEIKYMTAKGDLLDIRDDPNAAKKGTMIRHGFGIQMFTKGNEVSCKYEGYWDKGRKTGLCKIYYPDKAVYEGVLVDGIKEGYGTYTWANGDYYLGNWSNNRFEGGGTFHHHKGNVLKGIFKNNYFVKAPEVLINPFFSLEEIDAFLKRRSQINVLRERNEKEKKFFFEQTSNMETLAECIRRSNLNSRIPLVFSSKQSNRTMNEVFSEVSSIMKQKWTNFDLRRIHNEKKQGTHKQYLAEVKENLSDTLTLGQIFVINLDDSNIDYDEIFYPDIQEFYSSNFFPQQIWNLKELEKPSVFDKIVGYTNNYNKTFNPDFRICIWTKFKVDQNVDHKKVIEIIERRLSTILPMIKIDFIVHTAQEEQLVDVFKSRSQSKPHEGQNKEERSISQVK